MSESLTLKESILMMVMTAKTKCIEFVHPCVAANQVVFSRCIQNKYHTNIRAGSHPKMKEGKKKKEKKKEQTISM